ncbi:NeuD/PglB/VioB family sugar acetyltransferase [Leifsonia sp. F6_8S_P_1B]|uniref:NeuD/PglB/VioB family sugar acetyltransferase n=1 Tax=Leifsonia williamsii TaxID=3035919 RepID=A0ABT8K627_9MICO|nr:NeuD/PglB/VioB family sugar acetyltransferase [Leifsonia williamsii]MDN4612896.1 NeuD/PglB/VioB family sugar acetyltransferase [Leifsonia williamsii]
MTDVILIAASGLAREVIAMDQSGHRVVGVLDDDTTLHGQSVGGVEVLGGIELAARLPGRFAVCVGAGAGRRMIVGRLAALGIGDDRFATLVDTSARIGAGSALGPGTIVLAGCVLTADVLVGRHVVLMPHCTLTHDDIVDDFATFAAGVAVGGVARIGEAAYLGMNSSVRQRVSIGADATIGMGAVVLADVPDGQIWAGVPAKELGVRL